MTSPKLQTLNFGEDINNLLCQIDGRLASEAKGKLDSLRYGAKICVDYEKFHSLSIYKKILIKKASNSCCLSAYLIDDIISRIKQLLNKN